MYLKNKVIYYNLEGTTIEHDKHLSPWANGGFAPSRGNFLDHNIIVPTCPWVRKIIVATRIKGVFCDYGISYQTTSKLTKNSISSFKQLQLS